MSILPFRLFFLNIPRCFNLFSYYVTSQFFNPIPSSSGDFVGSLLGSIVRSIVQYSWKCGLPELPIASFVL